MKSKKIVIIKKILLLTVAFILVALLYFNHNYKLYKKGKESVFEKMSGFIPYEITQAEKKMYKDNQYITIGDYTITLEDVVYSREKNEGWCKFAVTRPGHLMEWETGINRNDLSVYNSPFGTRRNLVIDWAYDAGLIRGVETKMWFKAEKTVMYVYYYISVDDSSLFNHCIYLYDVMTGKGTRDVFQTQSKEDMSGIFELRENTDTKRYTFSTLKEDYEIVISPYTCSIRGEGNPKITDLEIHLKNGSILNVKKNSIFSGDISNFGEYIPDEERHLRTYSCVLGFTKYTDIEEIDSVYVNGEKL